MASLAISLSRSLRQLGRRTATNKLRSPRFVVGADIGRAQDYSAIALVEPTGQELQLRHLERLPLGLPYAEITARLDALVQTLPDPVDLVINATDIDRPVLDMLRAAGLDPVAVTIAGTRAISLNDDGWRVPQRSLVRALVTAFQDGRHRVAPRLPSASVLLHEVQALRRQISGRVQNGYTGTGEHTDLVVATALAC